MTVRNMADPIDKTGSDDITNENGNTKDLESSLVNSVLKLEEIDCNLYRGTHLWKPSGGRGVFGGQVVGQALAAAAITRPQDFRVHSLHCYFVQRGDPTIPILYHVDRIRDGNSFTVRSVKATQRNETILTMQVSYHKNEKGPFEYQYTMPQVPDPEDVPTTRERLQEFLEGDISERQRKIILRMLATELPIEIKPIHYEKHFRLASGQDPRSLYWVKAKGHIGDHDDLHHCVAAYISDMTLLTTALIPFPKFVSTMMASLDHAMWFHAPFQADEWMLYECESPRSVGARSMVHGRLWRRDGVLAVTVAQEGVVRGKFRKSKL